MDILEKLSIILDYEFKRKRKRMRDEERSYDKLYVHLQDIKEDTDIENFISQLNKNIAYVAMHKIGREHLDVKEYIKKRKLNERK